MDSQRKENMMDFVYNILKMEIHSMDKLQKVRKKEMLLNLKVKNNNGFG